MTNILDKVVEVVHSLEKTNSRLEKEDILMKFMSSDDECSKILKNGFNICLDTYTTFGVKKLPEGHGGKSTDITWLQFLKLVDKLVNRELTGNAALDALKEFSRIHVSKYHWDGFFRRILVRDMRCGVNVSTWNNVAKKSSDENAIIPVFSCQLAKDGAKEKEITGDKMVEVKLDGVRVITIVRPDRTEMYSRNGKRLTNFTKIVKWFEEKVAPHVKHAMVFDGEIMSSSFNDLMTQVNRKSDVSTDDAVLHLFDCLPLDAFSSGQYSRCNVSRKDELEVWADFFRFDIMRTVKHVIIDFDTEDGIAEFKQLNKAAIAGGYEGLMLKDPLSPYTCKRNKDWLKIKPFIEVTLNVVAIEEGTGKYVGSTGALVCEGVDDGVEIKVNVGSGLSDEMRRDIYVDQSKVIGQLVEIKADAISQNSNGTNSLRFPRFKTFRGFDINEKL
jgi:DNA ligase-1